MSVDFISSLPLDHRWMLAVFLAESFRTRQGMGVVNAACEAGLIVGYRNKTVCKLRTKVYENKGVLRERKQGKYDFLQVGEQRSFTFYSTTATLSLENIPTH